MSSARFTEGLVAGWKRRLREAPGHIRAAGSVRTWLFYLPGPGPWLMSWLRRQWVLFVHPRAHIEFRGPVYLGPGFSLHMPQGGTFIVGQGVEFRRGFRAEIGPDARVEIGDGCHLTYDVLIQCATTITLGERVQVGQDAMFVDGNHRYRDLSMPFLDQGYDFRPITVDNDAVILSKVTIVNNIGERSIIGANSVITRPIPPYCVAAGVPARVIDYFGPPGLEPPEFTPRPSAPVDAPG